MIVVFLVQGDVAGVLDASDDLDQTSFRIWRRLMRSRLPWVVGLGMVLAVAALALWRFGLRDTATPVSAADVVEDAVQAVTPPTATMAPAPAPAPPGSEDPVFIVGNTAGGPGLYVYVTDGYEEIDALGGARHDYPTETFLTIQPGGCGVGIRWTALEERWDELELCPTDEGWSVAQYDAFHEWFGQSDLQEFSCGPSTATAIPDRPEGSATYECSNDARTEVWTVAVIGSDEVRVDGQDLAAVHVRVTSVLTGDSIGSSRSDTWYLEGTPLVLRRTMTRSSVNESLVGAVTYTEMYEIVLASLMPQGETRGG